MQLPNVTPNFLGTPGTVGGVQPGVTSGNAQKAGGRTNGELPFADMVKGLIEDTNNQQHQVNESVEKMVSGETDSIHDVVMTASRADLAFRLVMEIRNRMISSYQEIMRMQV
jgi:flagellar hook-basal body complex protein FliE